MDKRLIDMSDNFLWINLLIMDEGMEWILANK